MKNDYNREEIIARLLGNTRRRNRPNNIVKIAGDIRLLENDLGSLKEISGALGITTQMLRRFLSVEKLDLEVKNMVRRREIDSVAIIDILRRFEPESQRAIAKEIILGHLDVDNMKVLSALCMAPSNKTIEDLISSVRDSENKKVYVIKFKISKDSESIERIRKRFQKIVDAENMISFTISKALGTLELTNLGRKKMIEAAKTEGLSLRRLVANIIKE